MSNQPSESDGAEYRRVLGRYPTGVTLVSAADDDGPLAMVIGSFGSVSLDPPLVQFMPAKSSSSWARIEQSGGYCVNVLGTHQLDLANAFFSQQDDPFAGCTWRTGPSGSPVIEESLAWIDCSIDAVHDAGDHWIVVGAVLALGCVDPQESTESPLLFQGGAYGSFAPLPKD